MWIHLNLNLSPYPNPQLNASSRRLLFIDAPDETISTTTPIEPISNRLRSDVRVKANFALGSNIYRSGPFYTLPTLSARPFRCLRTARCPARYPALSVARSWPSVIAWPGLLLCAKSVIAGNGLWAGTGAGGEGAGGVSGQQQRTLQSSRINIINCAMCWQLNCQLCIDRDKLERNQRVDLLFSYDN